MHIGAVAQAAEIGFLMEISPDDQRPAYSSYFNVLSAPAFLLPLLGGIMVDLVSIHCVFFVALAGAAQQWLFVRLINRVKITVTPDQRRYPGHRVLSLRVLAADTRNY